MLTNMSSYSHFGNTTVVFILRDFNANMQVLPPLHSFQNCKLLKSTVDVAKSKGSISLLLVLIFRSYCNLNSFSLNAVVVAKMY